MADQFYQSPQQIRAGLMMDPPVQANPWVDPINVVAGAGGLMRGGVTKALAALPGMIASEVPMGLAGESAQEYTKDIPYVRHIAPLIASMGAGMMTEPLVRGFSNAASKVTPQLLVDETGAITWHGSPHKWDKPDISKVGTGEGAQAYGHGFYSAENADVAKSYAPRDFDAEDEIMALYKGAEARQDYLALEVYERALNHETPEEIRAFYTPENGYDAKMIETAHQVAATLDQIAQKNSFFYKLDLPDEDISKMLDWGKPIKENPALMEALNPSPNDLEFERISQLMREAADKANGPEGIDEWERLLALRNELPPPAVDLRSDGEKFYHELATEKGGPAAASDYLLSLGIPGIKYLDGMSRGAGEGTRNFVSFDPRNINVLERNGQPIQRLMK